NEVITQVPWLVLTPRLPAMVGIETLAMVESSTCMKVPSASAIEVSASSIPVIGVMSPAGGAVSAMAQAPGLLGSARAGNVDGRLHGQPDPQGMADQFARVELDTHRQAL